MYTTELVDTSFGFKIFIVDGDQHVGYNIKKSGTWEPEVVAWLNNNIKPGYNCLDIGSNIGFFTEFMARKSGKGGSVHAFEPNTHLVEIYRSTRQESGNSYDDVADIFVYPFALSEVEDSINLLVPDINIGGAALTMDNSSSEGYHVLDVRTKNINDLLSDHQLSTIDLIKIDIEGYEPFVWNTLYKALPNAKAILAELGPYHPKEFIYGLADEYEFHALNGDGIVGPEHILNYRHHLNISLVKK
jgi:FkbM family methyltransferase